MKDKLTFLQKYIENPLKDKKLLPDQSKLKATFAMILTSFLKSIKKQLQDIMNHFNSIQLTE